MFLHYVFDLWVDQWRTRHGRGKCSVVRYADDFVIGFEHESDALACLASLKERLQKFGLELHPEKTRLLEFGRRASDRRLREGREPCETFEFLGFTHSCGVTKKNKRFVLLRRTSGKRLTRTLAAVKVQLRRRRHDSVGETGRWLASVIRGWLGYHAVPDNYTRLEQFVTEVTKLWLHQLRRRSQKGRAAWPWERMNHLVDRYLPQPPITFPLRSIHCQLFVGNSILTPAPKSIKSVEPTIKASHRIRSLTNPQNRQTTDDELSRFVQWFWLKLSEVMHETFGGKCLTPRGHEDRIKSILVDKTAGVWAWLACQDS